ncbi:MAG: AsnC family transcriptional regulator [Nitrososphaerales archaeon]
MPYQLDEIDAKILKALMDDGRRSDRELARFTDVSTPTVGSRLSKMFSAGIIKKIAPILDLNKIGTGTVAVLMIKADSSKAGKVAKTLASLEGVRAVRLITGDHNIFATLATTDSVELQDYVDRIGKLSGILDLQTQIVTKTVKDEYWVPVRSGLSVNLACDYCGNEIKIRPQALKVGHAYRYFCCRLCKVSYKKKYQVRIKKMNEVSNTK